MNWLVIEDFLAGRSVEERDRVIAAIRWGSIFLPAHDPRRSGNLWAEDTLMPCCLVDHACGKTGAFGHNGAASNAYEYACRDLGVDETVRRCKEIAARLNGCSPDEIAKILAPANAEVPA